MLALGWTLRVASRCFEMLGLLRANSSLEQELHSPLAALVGKTYLKFV